MQAIGVGNAHNFLWFCIIAKKARAKGEEMKTCRDFDVLRENELKPRIHYVDRAWYGEN